MAVNKIIIGAFIVLALFVTVRLVWFSHEDISNKNNQETNQSFDPFDHDAHH